MKSGIETFMAVILIALMVIISTCFITASLNTRAAQDFHSAVIAEIEYSNLSDTVIDECKTKATENGFTSLEVTKMGSMGTAEVKLTYSYSISFLNTVLEHEIVGYAR